MACMKWKRPDPSNITKRFLWLVCGFVVRDAAAVPSMEALIIIICNVLLVHCTAKAWRTYSKHHQYTSWVDQNGRPPCLPHLLYDIPTNVFLTCWPNSVWLELIFPHCICTSTSHNERGILKLHVSFYKDGGTNEGEPEESESIVIRWLLQV